PRRDVLAALPRRGGIEETAVSTGVKIGAALDADFIERRILQADALLSALVALERLGTETASRASTRRSFDALSLRVRPRTLRPRLLTTGRVRTVSATVLIAAMFVLTIAHIHTARKHVIEDPDHEKHTDDQENQSDRHFRQLQNDPDHEDDDEDPE